MYIFPLGMSAILNINSLFQNLNSDRHVHLFVHNHIISSKYLPFISAAQSQLSVDNILNHYFILLVLIGKKYSQ